MAAPRRAPTPLRSSTSSSPLEAMIASKQAHIEELVTQTRTLEHTISKLRAALGEEQVRAQDAVSALQKRWKAERAEWRDGCETLQAAHRIAHLRTAVELDRERVSVLKEREEVRRERLARLQRDFRLVTFQLRETELEERVATLEAEIGDAERAVERERQKLSDEVDGKAGALEARCEGLAAQLRDSAKDLTDALKEKADVKDAISRLKTEHNALVDSSKKTESTLERTTLHLDGLKSTHAELEKKHGEAEQTVVELRRQLEKWHKLESREGAEMDALRRERMGLVVQVETLQTQVKELEERAEELEGTAETATEKRKQKDEEYREALDEWKIALEEAQEKEEKLEAEAEELRGQLEDAQKKIKALKVHLSTTKTEARQATVELHSTRESSPKAVKKMKQSKRTPPVRELSSTSEKEVDEVEEVVVAPSPSPQPKRNSRSKPRKAQKVDSTSPKLARNLDVDSDEEIQEVEPPKKTKRQPKPQSKNGNGDSRTGKSKTKRKPRKDEDEEEVEVEVEIVEDKRIAGRKGKRKAEVLEEGDVEEPKPARKRNKKKSGDEDEDEDSGTRNKVRPKAKAATAAKPSSKDARRKPPGRAQSKQPRQDDSSDEAVVIGDGTPKNKKRRLNVFPTVAPMKFDWNPLATSEGSLNIPTELSPVKESDAIPPRTSAAFRAVGSMFGSFGSRR